MGPLFLGELAGRLCPAYMADRTLKKELKRRQGSGQIIRVPSELPENGGGSRYAGLYLLPEFGRDAELELRLRTAEGKLVNKISSSHLRDMPVSTVSAQELSRSQHLIAVFDYRIKNRAITYGSFPLPNTFMQQE